MASSPGSGAPTHRHRRGRGYFPFEARGGQPVLPAGRVPLRAGQCHRHLQQAVRPVGRSLRRRDRGGGHDRPAGPPRRGSQPQGRQLPPQGPRPGEGANRRRSVTTRPTGGSIFNRWKRVSFQASLTQVAVARTATPPDREQRARH